MRKPIFESEKECSIFYSDNSDIIKASRIDFISCMKSAGYIRRSPVDEAEEMYDGYLNRINKTEPREMFQEIIEKQHEAIQYLKERQK